MSFGNGGTLLSHFWPTLNSSVQCDMVGNYKDSDTTWLPLVGHGRIGNEWLFPSAKRLIILSELQQRMPVPN